MNVEQIKAALASDHDSALAYAGRVIQKETLTVPDADGNPIHIERDIVITRVTIETILEMVRQRAGI